MRAFAAIVIKDLRLRFSSVTEIVFFLLLPVVFTVVLSGTALSSKGKGGTAALPLVLFQDTVMSAQTQAFGTMLHSMPGVQVREVSDPTALASTAEADLLIRLTEGHGGGLPFTATFRLSPWRSSARATAEAVGAWLDAGGREAAPPVAAGGPPARAGSAQTSSSAAAGSPSAAETSSAGETITWVLVPLLGLGAGIVAERTRGTGRRIQASPVSPFTASAASVTAEVIGALVQIALLVAFGAAVFGLPWLSHPVQLLGLSVAFCIAGASLGALLGAVCRTRRQASSLALILALVMAVLGGCWYPSSLFPASLRDVAGLDPAGWAMDGFLSVLSPLPGAAQAVTSMAMLLAFGAAVFGLAALVSRRRAALAA